MNLNLIYDTQSKLRKFALYNDDDIVEDTQYEFRVTLRNFGKWYNYVAQLDRTFDMELLEENIYTSYLLKFIPKEKREKVYITEKVKLEYYKLQKDFEGEIMACC
ncbi:hypothetical protein ACFU2N_12230 [Bacillus velezensis]|uniref:hypothetical protein n=1 Tax=Bacillus TaxID=1386 RepID=UPI001E35BE09|nr:MULTISPECIES: hypothetical protein [Bacillus]MEC1906638.1 hypothetical protein [Bacillus velezensis]